MRRRRNADAPSTTDETTDVIGSDSSNSSNSSDIETSGSAAAPNAAPPEPQPTEVDGVAAAAAKPPRRRRKTAELAAPSEPVPGAAETPTAPETEAAPTEEKPKRTTRRRTPKTDAAEAPAGAVAAPEIPYPDTGAPTVAEAPAGVVLPSEEAAAELAAEDAVTGGRTSRGRRSRSRRGANAAAAAETPEAAPTPIAQANVPQAVASTGDAEEVVASGAGEAAALAETIAEAASDAEAQESRTRRTRGLRRRPAAGAQFVAAPTLAAEITPEPAAAPAETEALGETEPGSEVPKRTRGLRRRTPTARTAAGGGAAAAPVPTLSAAAAPAEPIPPPYQPLPQETLSRLPETRVVVRGGLPELQVNGTPRLPLWFFVNTENAESPEDGQDVAVREIRMAYEAGIRAFSVLAHLPWKTRSGERRYDVLDNALQIVAENAPDALILPRLIFSPLASWERAHPDEMTQYPDGERSDVSLASRAFWEGEADEALRAAVEHVAQGPHAGRVFGFYLEHGEWLFEKGRGYDVSPANRAGFRAWLRQKYRRDQVALRAAWHDGTVTFDSAEIPSWPPPAGSTLFFSPREQRWTDFHEYSSDTVAQVILRLGKAVKEASGSRSAVAVSYGYTLELPRAYSGHLALGQLLASPNIDILTGPVSYSGRTPGGSATFPAPIESITLAGKLWVSEDDSKTYLASDQTPDTYNPKIATLDGTRAVQARNFGAALARGTGVSWMDLWGEGWLDDREAWHGIAYLRHLADLSALRRHSETAADAAPVPEPDVAVLVDERSFFGVRADEFLLGHLVSQQRDALLRSGARVGFYLLTDLAKPDFPRTPKLLLFLNAYRIPGSVRAAIRERFQDGGRTLAWLFAPGALDQAGGDAATKDLYEVVGMQLRQQPWGSKAGTQVLSSVRSPLTDAVRGQKIGEETRFNPTYYVSDPKAQALGEYTQTGNPSLAVRKHARWQSVFLGEPASLTVALLRGLYRLAGVPIYTVDDDATWVGDRLICLHSAPGGGTTVFQAAEGALMDLLTGETLTSGGWGARLSMPPRGTRLLFYGSPSEIARFGGDTSMAPLGLSEEELPPPPAPFVFENEPAGAARRGQPASSAARAAEVDPEDAALFEAALEREFPFEGDEDADEAAEAVETLGAGQTAESADGAGRKKRRRRRRGRGRGREGAEAEEGGDESAADRANEDTDEGVTETDIVYEGEAPGTVIFDSADLSDVVRMPPSAESAAAPRPRPSLEELLPQSDLLDGSELPPIPEEFLPLADEEFGITAASGAAAPPTVEAEADAVTSEEAPAATGRRPRRGGTRYRRGRRLNAGESSGDDATESTEATESPAESIPPAAEPGIE